MYLVRCPPPGEESLFIYGGLGSGIPILGFPSKAGVEGLCFEAAPFGGQALFLLLSYRPCPGNMCMAPTASRTGFRGEGANPCLPSRMYFYHLVEHDSLSLILVAARVVGMAERHVAIGSRPGTSLEFPQNCQ